MLSALALVVVAVSVADAQPTLAVVDATERGAPDVAAEVARVATAAHRFDVRPAEEVDAAVLEAKKIGAACGIDDPPECWARLGIMAELDRILVVCVRAGAVDVLLVDVPARTAARTQEPAGEDAKAAAGRAVQALLEGKVTSRKASPTTEPTQRGAGFWAGVYVASFGGLALVGCTVAAIAVSAELANELHAAKDDGVRLPDAYPALSGTFWVLAAGAAVGGLVVATGAGMALVLE